MYVLEVLNSAYQVRIIKNFSLCVYFCFLCAVALVVTIWARSVGRRLDVARTDEFCILMLQVMKVAL